jgi:MFS family permease
MAAPAPPSRRLLFVLCIASAGWAFSFGLSVPLGALWLENRGCSQKVIGLNSSLYYLGVAGASLVLPALMRRSSRRCVVAGMIIDGLATALFPFGFVLPAWLALRLLAGVATALSLIPMETLVNQHAPPDKRAANFGIYAFCVALGIGVGALVGMPLYPFLPQLAFALGGAVALASAALVGWGLPAEPIAEAATSVAPPSFLANFLSYGTAWTQGVLEAGMFTFLSGYLLTLGYTENGVSGLLGVLFLGVIAFQIPLAQLADRLGRKRMLLGCHAVVLAGVAVLPWLAEPLGLGATLFVVGACCAALYPLGLAVLGERMPQAAMGRANAWYLASNCAGSLSGPVLTGAAMDWFGRRALFASAATAVLAVVGTWLVGHILRHKTPAHTADENSCGVIEHSANLFRDAAILVQKPRI